jgi:hypothetical protein
MTVEAWHRLASLVGSNASPPWVPAEFPLSSGRRAHVRDWNPSSVARIDERDVQVLVLLLEHKVLTTHQIASLCFRSVPIWSPLSSSSCLAMQDRARARAILVSFCSNHDSGTALPLLRVVAFGVEAP